MSHSTHFHPVSRPLRASALLALLLIGLFGLRPPPVALAACGGVTIVTNETQLNNAITTFNNISVACNFTIELWGYIYLTDSTKVIDNDFSGVTLTIDGRSLHIDGQGTEGVRPLTIAADTVVTLRRITITGGNPLDVGGGISNEGHLTIIDSIIYDNTSRVDANALGGGIYNYGSLSLVRTTVSDNTTEANRGNSWGGGIANLGSLLIRDSSIFGNEALSAGSARGGGILTFGLTGVAEGGAELKIINSTISENSTASSGNGASAGGLYVTTNVGEGSTPVTLINTTMADNRVANTGGISGSGARFEGGPEYLTIALTIHNSILANHVVDQPGKDCQITDGSNYEFTSRNSLYGNSGDDACGLAATGPGPDANGNIVGHDPKLGSLATNGGPTQTHMPAPDSPAVDAGDDDLAKDEGGDALLTDQRGTGFPRKLYDRVDMGAVESFCAPEMSAANEAELNAAIRCYNRISTPGDYTITLSAEIGRANSTPFINNNTPGVSLTIEGNGFAIDGQDKPGVRPLTVVADTVVTLRRITITGGNPEDEGGGIYNDGRLTIIDSVIHDNTASSLVYAFGGGIFNRGSLSLVRTTVSNNIVTGGNGGAQGGGIDNLGYLLVRDSSIIGNRVFSQHEALGSGIYSYTEGAGVKGLKIINSTISGNDTESTFSTTVSGGLNAVVVGEDVSEPVPVMLINATVTDNSVNGSGITLGNGVLFNVSSTGSNPVIAIHNSILAGNNTGEYPGMDCVLHGGNLSALVSRNSLYGHSGNSACGLAATGPGGDANGNLVGHDAKLGPLAANGGDTQTHLPAMDSPAVNAGDDDLAVDEGGADLLFDQRGAGYDRVNGSAVDMGAVEAEMTVFMSAATSGNAPGVGNYNNADILKWDGSTWSKFFDAAAAGLAPNNKPKHNVNAFWIPDPDAPDVVMAFAQNGRKVGTLPGKVDGMDLVWWDGTDFSLWFDGSDVGLTKKTPEKIDGLHVLPGDAAPALFDSVTCHYYLLISTMGPGDVTAPDGSRLKFGGEDVLGFCMTNQGETTAGFWHMVLDGSAEYVKKNAIDSISLSADGQTLYVTTKANFVADSAIGGHSSVYAYDLATELGGGDGAFSGPLFRAAPNGLTKKVDGLQMD